MRKRISSAVKGNPLYFAFLFPALMDGVVTILGQGTQYWNTPGIATDASPAYYFLISSPWFFILGSVFWFILWYLIFKKVSDTLQFNLMFLFIAGHSWGSSSWLIKMLKAQGYFTLGDQFGVMSVWALLVLYFFLISLFATYCMKVYLRERG